MRERRLAKRALTIENRVSLLPQPRPQDIHDPSLLLLPSNEGSAPLLVPHGQRIAGGEALQSHVRFVGFDDILPPGLGFSRLFNSNANFRSELRHAARVDFGTAVDTPAALLHDPRSSLSGRWLNTACNYDALSDVLQKHVPGGKLTGPAFIEALTSLCPDTPHRFGSWMDIVGVQGRRVPHSFHQDSGLCQTTIMIGFPPRDNFEGVGVFSHVVKLSHRLPPPPPEQQGHIAQQRPRLWEDATLLRGEVPTESVVRPVYREGREMMVYDDRDVFHSSPDYCSRESVWRIM